MTMTENRLNEHVRLGAPGGGLVGFGEAILLSDVSADAVVVYAFLSVMGRQPDAQLDAARATLGQARFDAACDELVAGGWVVES